MVKSMAAKKNSSRAAAKEEEKKSSRTLTALDIISREVRTTLIAKNLYEETTETTLMRYRKLVLLFLISTAISFPCTLGTLDKKLDIQCLELTYLETLPAVLGIQIQDFGSIGIQAQVCYDQKL